MRLRLAYIITAILAVSIFLSAEDVGAQPSCYKRNFVLELFHDEGFELAHVGAFEDGGQMEVWTTDTKWVVVLTTPDRLASCFRNSGSDWQTVEDPQV